jgi:hypothetical protein
VIGDKIHDSRRSLSVRLVKRMRLITNNSPPAHLLARGAIAVATILGMVCRVGSEHLVCGHNNGVLGKQCGVACATLAMVRIH